MKNIITIALLAISLCYFGFKLTEFTGEQSTKQERLKLLNNNICDTLPLMEVPN